MTFPDVLVERVARAMYEGPSSDWDHADPDDRDAFMVYATAALEAMNMREQRVRGSDRAHTRWVAMTDWEWEHDD